MTQREATEMKGKKKFYPISGTKHAHDIGFRRARCKNEFYEMGMDDKRPYSAKPEKELWNLKKGLANFLTICTRALVIFPLIYTVQHKKVSRGQKFKEDGNDNEIYSQQKNEREKGI